MRIGIIGTGNIANHHARGIKAAGHEIAIVADAVKEKAQAYAAAHGGRATTSVDELLAEPEGLDLVTVAVPNEFHFDIASRAVAAGHAVFCEKPLTAAVETSRKLVEQVRRRGQGGRPFFVGYMKRAHPVTQRFKEYAGQIGPIRSGLVRMIPLCPMEVWTKMARDVAADPNSPHWQSGVLLNCACHLLDLLLWTCGPVKRVVGSRLQYQPGCGKVDSAVHALLEMENGASILLESLFSPLSGVGLRENGRDEMIELRGDEGLARVQTTLWEQPMIQYPIAERWSEADHAWERYSPGPVDNMEQQYRYIAGALGGSGETCPLATAEEALRLDELMQDIALAAAEDDKVTR